MKNNIIHTGKIVALLSFVIGTILLSLYLYFGDLAITTGFAISFIAIALIVNSILFAIILVSAIFKPNNRTNAIETCGLMLLNIPIAILYFYMVVTFPGNLVLL